MVSASVACQSRPAPPTLDAASSSADTTDADSRRDAEGSAGDTGGARTGDTEDIPADATSDAGDARSSDAGRGLPPGCSHLPGEFARSSFGGDARVKLKATGFFRVQQLCERWSFVTLEGHPT